jgi:hypothetical protein
VIATGKGLWDAQLVSIDTFFLGMLEGCLGGLVQPNDLSCCRLLPPLVAAITISRGGMEGWLFPKGQLALWADRSVLFSPPAPLGRLTTEILQCAWGEGGGSLYARV